MMKKLYTNVEAAEVLGLKPNTLEQWRIKGVGPRFIRIGRSIRYPVDELDGFLSGLERCRSTAEADRVNC